MEDNTEESSYHFISYAREHREWVEKLADYLRKADFKIWYDAELLAGKEWEIQILSRIRHCKIFIFIISQEALDPGSFCLKELDKALKWNKPILPVLIDPKVIVSDLPDELKKRHYFNATTGNLESISLSLTGKINQLLRDVVEGQRHTRYLEAAVPEKTRLNTPTEVWVKISRPYSLGLGGELPDYTREKDLVQKGDVRGTSFPFVFPSNRATGRLEPATVYLKVMSDDFAVRPETVRGQAGNKKQVELNVPPDHDSQTVIFRLVPRASLKPGRSRIYISLHDQKRLIGQVAVSTVVVETEEQLARENWSFNSLPMVLSLQSPDPQPAKFLSRRNIFISLALLLAAVLFAGVVLFLDDREQDPLDTAEVPSATLTPTLTDTPSPTLSPTSTFTFTSTFSPTPTFTPTLPTCVPPLSEEQGRTATWESLVARQTQLARATQFPTTYPITATWEALIARQTQLSAIQTGTPDCVP
ncbi:MAG: toll/interleukin-1 receptor domain-containing protein [Anaerolineae bacterium]|nr:toll/interleukin-1 receptor domain-containing protein [Anaerolineae bacterium]